MRPTLHIADDQAGVAGPLLKAAILDTILATGRCRLALCGGNTPGTTLAWLGIHLPPTLYPRLWITWVDERHTPAQADRNDALAHRLWLHARPDRTRHLSMGTGSEPLATAVSTYIDDFNEKFGGLDVVLLGAGADGHIASLFPGAAALESTAVAVGITDSPKPPPERISLTLPVLAATRCVVLLARGADKADMLAQAQAGALPLGRLAPAGAYHWILDSAAAARLSPGAAP